MGFFFFSFVQKKSLFALYLQFTASQWQYCTDNTCCSPANWHKVLERNRYLPSSFTTHIRFYISDTSIGEIPGSWFALYHEYIAIFSCNILTFIKTWFTSILHSLHGLGDSMRLGGKAGKGWQHCIIYWYNPIWIYASRIMFLYLLHLGWGILVEKAMFWGGSLRCQCYCHAGGLQLEGRNHIGSSSCTSKGDAGDGKRWDKVLLSDPKMDTKWKRAMAIGPWFHSCG